MLTLEEVIVESNDDIEIWSSIVVGFDMAENFIIRLEHIDYDEHENDYSISVLVDKEEALVMSDFLHVQLTHLPKVLLKEYGCAPNLLVSSEVERLLKDIIDFVLDCGAHYKLVRG